MPTNKRRWDWGYLFELLLTFLGWLYVLGFSKTLVSTLWAWVRGCLVGAAQPVVDLASLKIMASNVAIAVCLVGVMLVWVVYNLRRFGWLRRRSFPDPVEVDDVVSFFSIGLADVERLQAERWIELEDSLV